MRNYHILLVACIAFAALAGNSEGGQNVAAWSNVPIMDANGTVHSMTIYPFQGEIVLYADDDTSCSTHTTKASRHFEHVHINVGLNSPSLTWSSRNSDQYGNTIPVTVANIRAYWNHHYSNLDSGYVNSGGEDVTYNCHPYAMAKYTSCWVQGMTYIDADDLTAASDWDDCKLLRDGDVHTVKVAAYCQGESVYQIDTEEKYRESGIYLNSWVDRDPVGPSTKMKFKP